MYSCYTRYGRSRLQKDVQYDWSSKVSEVNWLTVSERTNLSSLYISLHVQNHATWYVHKYYHATRL